MCSRGTLARARCHRHRSTTTETAAASHLAAATAAFSPRLAPGDTTLDRMSRRGQWW